MRIRKLLIGLCAMIITSLSVCTGCMDASSYPFYYDEAKIKSISIAHTLDDYNEYETLVVIDDISAFLTEFKKIQFGRYVFGDPSEIPTNENVILIYYQNGDYEIIHCYAQDRLISGENYFGKVYCNEVEFKNFINLYLNECVN